jgi:hypothetical protein
VIPTDLIQSPLPAGYRVPVDTGSADLLTRVAGWATIAAAAGTLIALGVGMWALLVSHRALRLAKDEAADSNNRLIDDRRNTFELAALAEIAKIWSSAKVSYSERSSGPTNTAIVLNFRVRHMQPFLSLLNPTEISTIRKALSERAEIAARWFEDYLQMDDARIIDEIVQAMDTRRGSPRVG